MTQLERRSRSGVTVRDEGFTRSTDTDLRSVGELLVASDHLARGLLFDLDEVNAVSALGTWGHVVRSAHQLWVALPAAPPSAAAPDHAGSPADPVLGRLLAMTNLLEANLTRSTSRLSWPGPGAAQPDDCLLRIATNFDTARRLVTSRDLAPRASREVQSDVAAARTRLLHTLYVAAHGVGLAVGRHVRDLETARAATGPRRRAPSDSLPAARAAHRRLLGFEQVAGSALTGRIPHGLDGEHRQPSPANALSLALARWDIQAHRSLCDRLSTADLMVVAHTQAVVLSGTGALLRAAAATGQLDSRDDNRRLAPTVQATHHQWVTMARLWADLTPAMTRTVDAHLGRASDAARAALHDVLLDRAALSTPDVIGQRTDLAQVHHLVVQALISSADLAQATHDAASTPELSAPARAVLTVATQHLTPRYPQTIDASPHAAWVSARDHAANHLIPLPDEVRFLLKGSAAELVALTRRAAAEYDTAARSGPAATLSELGDTTRRQARSTRSPLPSAVPAAPNGGFGCDR